MHAPSPLVAAAIGILTAVLVALDVWDHLRRGRVV